MIESSENEESEQMTSPAYNSIFDIVKALQNNGNNKSPEELTAPEVESNFGTLSLAFKTDKFTLTKRLELQKRQRDTAENNISKEVDSMRDALNSLNHLCTDSQMRETIVKLQHHVDIIHQSTSRMSSRAEVYGAVQQEERMSHAYEIMVTYVENLKRLYQKEHLELEETRRLLIENRLLPPMADEHGANGQSTANHGAAETFKGLMGDDPKRPLRSSVSSASSSFKPHQQSGGVVGGVTRRRASVAVFHRPLLEAAKSVVGSLSNLSGTGHGEFRARLYSAVTPLTSGIVGNAKHFENLSCISNSGNTSPVATTHPPSATASSPCSSPSSTSSSVFNQRFPFPSHRGTSSNPTSPAINPDDHHRLGTNSASEKINSLEKDERENNADESTETIINRTLNNKSLENDVESFNDDDDFGDTRQSSNISQRSLTENPSVSSLNTRCRNSINRRLSQFLPINSIRQSTFISNWLPDERWWSQWDLSSLTRSLRYGFGTLLLLGALFSLVFTFLPKETSAVCSTSGGSSASCSSYSIQEVIENLFRPYVSVKTSGKPL